MITFTDGPAAGASLQLARAPFFLRVVRVEPHGEWDALDQLDDTLAANEEAHVYRLAGPTGWLHIDGVDPKTKRRRGRTLRTGSYKLYDRQPAREVLADNKAWARWVDDQVARDPSYRCQFCERETWKQLWFADACPCCGRKYDAILAQESES